MGSISSNSPSAGPPDVLIQASPPHRRARAAAWSYHFYPDEAWFDLTVSLPCSVKLCEVHVSPHLSSLSTCPSAVAVEVSRDGVVTLPMCPPQPCSGMTSIKLQLIKPEVVSAVTLRLHRPLDSTTVGLSQIKLMGTLAFGSAVDLGRIASPAVPLEDYVSRTSIGWLRLLHHCLTVSKSMEATVATAAASIPNLLITCTALLISPSATIYAEQMEEVLLKIGLHSETVGLGLLGHILRNTQVNSVPMTGRLCGVASASTVDIIYQLGVTQDGATKARVTSLCSWLSDSAVQAVHRGPCYVGQTGELPPPAPQHVHCLAVVLWKNKDLNRQENITNLISEELVRSVFDWSTSLPTDSTLKRALDTVICSLCYVKPEFYSRLLEWLGILCGDDDPTGSSGLTDDSKDQRQASVTDDVKDRSGGEVVAQAPLTDDTKAEDQAYRQLQADEQAYRYSQTDDAQLLDNIQVRIPDDVSLVQQLALRELSDTVLNPPHLMSLAAASMSPAALDKLLNSGFLSMLCQALFEMCKNEITKYSESLVTSDSADRPGVSSRSERTGESRQDGALTPSQAAYVLNFLAELCGEVEVKNWLGNVHHSVFWPLLLNLLCTTPSHISSQSGSASKILSGQERALLETETVHFFKQCITCHPTNQTRFAQVLCDVLRNAGIPNGTMSGFLRRIFLQVLLEDEKVTVCVEADSHTYKGQAKRSGLQHPRFGTGHRYCTVQTSIHSTCSSFIIGAASDTPSVGFGLSDKEKGSAVEKLKDTSLVSLDLVKNISQAAGLSAQEKRHTKHSSSKDLPPRPPSRRGHRSTDFASNASLQIPVVCVYHSLMAGQPLPNDLSVAQLITLLQDRGMCQGQAYIALRLKHNNHTAKDTDMTEAEPIPDKVLLDTPSISSAIQVFASVGGLSLLAEHLPILYPELSRAPPAVSEPSKETSGGGIGHDWVTIEATDEFYDDPYEALPPIQNTEAKHSPSNLSTIPPHSLVSFGVFLRLPGYAEMLLKERRKAQCLLRLVLGVSDDGEGGHILSSAIASSLPTLPFTVLRALYDTTPLSTDDGMLLRKMTVDIGVIHLLMASLSVLSHHAPRSNLPGTHQEVMTAAMHAASLLTMGRTEKSADEKPTPQPQAQQQQYWAKGTGFGTGSTLSSWDAEQALVRQKSEEEHVTCVLQVLGSFINPGSRVPEEFQSDDFCEEELSLKANLPSGFSELLMNSCLVPAICSYLRNDSVLDMSRHIPLYRSLLELLRGLAVCPPLVPLLQPLDTDSVSITELLDKMKMCVDTYASRLKSNKKKSGGGSGNDREETESLALLIPNIQTTASIVHVATHRLAKKTDGGASENGSQGTSVLDHSLQDKYVQVMKELQFDTFELVVEDVHGVSFSCSHHYEANVKSAGEVNNAARARRLAQEAVTLSTSLPLSYNSTVFVRCDEERLDVMKVLITGPSDTPYGNGCFEFDVYFPQDYPNSPPLVNLETTGNRTVRFNPNLYNDGKVCLSVLNTWHGRPEEKWNAQTSSFLQVLVSIQSLILVNEPYFNEPGYERSRGTPSGMASSREYDANIRQATVKWAMLEMLRKPPPCFKEIIEQHFSMKKQEICAQVDGWIKEMEGYTGDKRFGRTSVAHSLLALKRHYSQLKEEFAKMKINSESEENSNQSNNNVESSSSSSRDAKHTQQTTDDTSNTVDNHVPTSQHLHPPSLLPYNAVGENSIGGQAELENILYDTQNDQVLDFSIADEEAQLCLEEGIALLELGPEDLADDVPQIPLDL